MRANAQGHPRNIFQRVPKLVYACLLLAVVLLYFLTYHPKPPDLTACTRIKVRYGDGALYFFCATGSMRQDVLNQQEKKYVQSYDVWTMTDREQIKALAQQVSQGTYMGWRWSLLALLGSTDPPTKIVGYRPSGRRISFSAYGGSEIRAGWRLFTYDSASGLSPTTLNPPGLKSLQARSKCGTNLFRLRSQGLGSGMLRPRPHLDPNHWCDTIVGGLRTQWVIHGELNRTEEERLYPDAYVARRFTCPSGHPSPDVDDSPFRVQETSASSQPVDTWISDYAMNSNCREDSPKDMVFLFESKPGWNQHGGPELFAFDNHDPRGGLVLLNGGTVKFIRTEEELKQLRWR